MFFISRLTEICYYAINISRLMFDCTFSECVQNTTLSGLKKGLFASNMLANGHKCHGKRTYFYKINWHIFMKNLHSIIFEYKSLCRSEFFRNESCKRGKRSDQFTFKFTNKIIPRYKCYLLF